MKAVALLAGASAIATALSLPAFAQTEIATGADAVGVTKLNDRIEDIEDNVKDDFARSQDKYRFGPNDQRQGLFGGVSLTYAGSTGNDESQDFALAGRVSYNQGQLAQSVALAIEFGEDDDGDKDKEDVYAIYDAQYYFNDQFYAFALGRVSVDGLVNDDINSWKAGTLSADDTKDLQGRLKRDAFLGFGPGYRVINNESTAWRVQAGVGVRYTQKADLLSTEADKLVSNTETAYIASSRFYHKFNENVFVTNDTDYLTSDEGGDTITNEFGVNFKMSDAFATRVSYRTQYESEREIRTDNRLGVSLVYGF